MTEVVTVFVRPGGTVEHLHHDAAPTRRLGLRQIRRVSHVEPWGLTDGPEWWASMHPKTLDECEDTLGPFDTRTEALEAEKAWLNQWLSGPRWPGASRTAPGRA